jgi:hypothetical protein
MKNGRYNGWSNRETWAYNLNLMNRYDTCIMMESWVGHYSVSEVEQNLRDYLTNLKKVAEILQQPNDVHNFLNDLGDTSLINFREIAENLLDGKGL